MQDDENRAAAQDSIWDSRKGNDVDYLREQHAIYLQHVHDHIARAERAESMATSIANNNSENN